LAQKEKRKDDTISKMDIAGWNKFSRVKACTLI